MTFQVGVFAVTCRVVGLGMLAATVVHAQALAPAPAPAPSLPVPMPRYTPAGTGAPVVGQPGEQVAPVARSPNTRVLPPTGEPGLWAADEPRAAKRPGLAPPDVDELLRPQPSPGTPELTSCRGRVRRASRDSGLEEVRRSLPGVTRECLTARLLLECFFRERLEFSQVLEKTPRTPEVVREVERLRAEGERVIRWEESACDGFLTLPFLEELRATIRAHLERQFRRPEAR